MTQAVTLYSVAAARGFPLSQVNLGRLFLLGEDGVTRDREAGKRLLTLAAESGDADAQMVVGMIHATPAFECYDLKLSEQWLRQSLAGGKQDAERLLVRVCQQMAQQSNNEQSNNGISNISITNNESNTENENNNNNDGNNNNNDGSNNNIIPDNIITNENNNNNNNNNNDNNNNKDPVVNIPVSQNALAAKLRGDDFVNHGLLHAAVLEYSRAFELDRTKLSYFVDRLDALCILGHYEECLTDSSLLLLCVDSNGLEFTPPNSSKNSSNSKQSSSNKNRKSNFPPANSRQKEVDFFRTGLQQSSSTSSSSINNSEQIAEKLKESQESMNR